MYLDNLKRVQSDFKALKANLLIMPPESRFDDDAEEERYRIPMIAGKEAVE
jgi:hypothetical protein